MVYLFLDSSCVFFVIYRQFFQFGRDFMGWVNAECTGVLDEPGLVENLQAEKFDVMILENFETCGVGEHLSLSSIRDCDSN